jgi:hypothetical protein
MLTMPVARIIGPQVMPLDIRRWLLDGLTVVGWEPLARIKVMSLLEHQNEWNALHPQLVALLRRRLRASLLSTSPPAARQPARPPPGQTH